MKLSRSSMMDIDTVQNTIRIRHGYSYQNGKLAILKGMTENMVNMDTGLLKRLAGFTVKSPCIFIFGGIDSATVLETADKEAVETKKKLFILGKLSGRSGIFYFTASGISLTAPSGERCPMIYCVCKLVIRMRR
jgi:hypothetical protein